MERAGIARKIAIVYLRYDIVSQKDLAIASKKLEAFHIAQNEISTRKDNQSKSQPANRLI